MNIYPVLRAESPMTPPWARRAWRGMRQSLAPTKGGLLA